MKGRTLEEIDEMVSLTAYLLSTGDLTDSPSSNNDYQLENLRLTNVLALLLWRQLLRREKLRRRYTEDTQVTLRRPRVKM